MKLKIAVLSPSRTHLADIARILQQDGNLVTSIEGGKSHLRSTAEREQPDILIADGMCCDVEELVQAEHVTTHFPGTAVVLMCSSHTPEYLLHAMRAGVREVLPSPVPPDALRSAIRRIAAKLRKPESVQAEVFAFLPCKGGAGATFLATNVAWELAQERKVLLLDLNLQFGDALAFLYDGRPAATLADLTSDPARLDASLLAASAVKITPNLSVLAAPDDPGQALEIQPEHVEAVLATAMRNYDFVLVDLWRTLDTATIKVLDRCTRAFPVLQPTLPAIRHAVKLRQVFQSLGYAPQKIQFVLNGCDRGAELGVDHVQRSLGAAVIPLAEAGREVTASINHGEPLVHAARTSVLARQIIEFARTLDPQPEQQRGLFNRIFRRA